MPTEIIVSLVGLAGIIIIALFNYWQNKEKNATEILHLKKQIENLEAQTKNLNTEIKTSSAEIEVLRKDTDELQQITSYKHSHNALRELKEKVISYLQEQEAKDRPAKVELKLIAVAMTFSWDDFIVDLPQLLERFRKSTITLDILFIHPEHLKGIRLSDIGPNWVANCERRIVDSKEFLKTSNRYGDRFKFRSRMYRNLPHWHGWLFNEQHLYLGRTDWLHENGKFTSSHRTSNKSSEEK